MSFPTLISPEQKEQFLFFQMDCMLYNSLFHHLENAYFLPKKPKFLPLLPLERHLSGWNFLFYFVRNIAVWSSTMLVF